MVEQEGKKSQIPPPRKARFIDPPNILRQKVGKGGLDQTRIDRAEEYIENNPADFTPFAEDIMERLDRIIAQAKSGKIPPKDAIDQLTRPIMELKANGGMFRYMLLSEIADIVLNFLENITELNNDVFEIIDAHQNTLTVIVTNKLQGGGGKEGQALAQELYAATRRYYAKHKIRV